MNRLIDFSSRFRILKGGKISLVVSAFLGGAIIANAAPSGGTVTSGNATINQSGNITNINQSSSKASINWNDFSIKSNETVNFNQPNVNSITLNRVIGTEKSVIDGALNANGQVWILNSNGILFGKNASVNTAGLLATTAQLSDADFQAGNYNFKNSSSNSVINLGTIKVQNSSYVILAGKEVQNGGNIEAVKGKVHLVGADSYSINLNGNSLVNLKVNKGVLDAMVKNSGNILANGGEIFLTTNAVDELLKGVVNNTGIIEANSLDGITGKVELFAHGGTAEISGNINAVDGFVETSGDKVKIADDFRVKADKWLIDPTDFTIAANGGDMTGATLSSNLASASVEIQSVNGATDGAGDIFVNDAISWDAATKLTLNAQNDIFINSAITASNASGQVALYYGQGAVASNNTADYYIKAPINLQAGDNFFTKLGSDGSETIWKVITSLGSESSTTGTDLQGINGNLSGNFVLGANINATATNGWDSNKGWTPIGNSSSKFTGNFDGLGHTVDNVKISNSGTEDDRGIGFFGITSGANIKNIGLTNVNIASTSATNKAFVGGLIGRTDGNTIIHNTYTTGIVTGADGAQAGGLVGGLFSSTDKISNSYSSTTVTSGTNKSSEGDYPYAGGLVGENDGGTISNSYATGNVTAGYKARVGGLVARNKGIIENSYATGDGYGGTSEGSSAYVGGLVGKNEGGTIKYSYALGDVSGVSGSSIGGLTGDNLGTITSSYYDKTINSSGMGDSSIGKTTTQLKTLSTFSTWDNNIWAFNTGAGADVEGYELGDATYPYLKNIAANKPSGETTILFAGGFGTEVNPYTITNWTQLQNINNSNILTQNYYFSLLNNLGSSTSDYTDLASSTANGGLGWNPIGWNPIGNVSSNFKGNFDGLGNTIDALTINNPNLAFAGLFVSINTANIKNIGLTNVNITGGDNAYIGGLVGYSYNSIVSNSYSTGSVTGGVNAKVGGLVGGNSNASTVSNSYSTASVTGGSGAQLGGLVGYNYFSTVSNSYSSGSVTSNINYAYAGGLVGVNLNNSTVSNSYSTASVTGGTGSILGGLVGFNSSSTINNSYYDKTLVTGMADESSYGKTTKELQTLATFGDAGWSIELDETMKKIYPYLTFDENGGAIWKVGKYATALNYILGTQNTTYNGTNQSLTDFWTNTIFGDDGSELVAGTDYKFVYNTSDTTSFKNAGTYNDISIVLLNEDYELDETGTNTLGKFVIAKANATVTANSDSKVYNGSTQTVSGFTASGLVNDETADVLDTITGATASGTNAGTYTTTLAGTDENYNLTFINGTLTINSAPVVTPPTPMPELETPVVVIPVTPDNIEKINNIISSITNTTSTLVPANISAIAVILTPNLTIPTTQTVVLINNGSSVRVMSQPIQNQNTTMVTMGELRANQDTNTPNGNSDIRVPVGDNSVIELINGGVNLPNGVEQQFFVVNTENNNI